MKQEKLSALVDGELDEADAHALTRKLADPETLARMELYYRIGEELRVDSAMVDLSPDFPDRLASALAAEPPYATPGMGAAEVGLTAQEITGKSELEPEESTLKRSLRQYLQGLVA